MDHSEGGSSGWLLQSLFYLPDPTGRPVLIFVAWTLVYELAFYLIYWLALRADVRRAAVAALFALVGSGEKMVKIVR